jgi:sugar transferase (PEP-CTERM/EpsH1 system associated)
MMAGKSLSEGVFYEPALTQILDEWQRNQPAMCAVVSASSLVPYLRRSRLCDMPAFVDLMDVDSEKWFDFAAVTRGPKRLLYRIEARRLRKLEASLAKTVAGVALVSRAEADIYEEFAGAETATVATNGVDLDYFTPVDENTIPACAFVGALDYLPNVDAAVWFTKEVWPRVRAKHPHAEFWLIGRKPNASVKLLAAEAGIKLIGQVPDVRPHLARAAVAVVPMRLSRGLQNKVLEALAMAKAVVAAPPALAALQAEPGRDLLVARTPQEWVDAVSMLLSDAGRRKELGQSGRRFVEKHHHWDTCLAPLIDKIIAMCCK